MKLTLARNRQLLRVILWMVTGTVVSIRGQEVPGDAVRQTKVYEASRDTSCGETLTDVLESDPFPFKPTPGHYKVIINEAHLDDGGSVGGVEAIPSGGGAQCPATPCDIWSETPHGQEATAVDIIDNRLSVRIEVKDRCAVKIGYESVSITWIAWCSSTCSDCVAGGSLSAGLGSLDVRIGLGKANYGDAAGQLVLRADSPSLDLAKPDGLIAQLGAVAEKVTNITSGVLRQIRTSESLADVVVSNEFQYSVKFYTGANFSTNKVGGYYQPTGQPFTTVTISNPDASTNVFHRLWVTECGELGDRQYEYEWDANTHRWELTSGEGLRREFRVVTWNGGQTVRVETNEIRSATGVVVFKQIEQFQEFDWGETNLVQRIVDPDGPCPLTNTWTFSTLQDNSYRQLAAITTQYGTWEHYNYGSGSRLSEKVMSDGSYTKFDYDTPFANAARTRIELGGHEIARSYTIEGRDVTTNIQCQTAGAEWTAADNLVTVTTRYTNGTFRGETQSVHRPNGTLTLYAYALATDGSTKTTTNDTGASNSDGTIITNGTRTITIVDKAGNRLSEQVLSIGSGGGLVLSESVVIATDQFGRATMQVALNGTNSMFYGCCGLTQQTDNEGITTYYTYDTLKRLLTTERAGIITSNVYDAAGRVLATFRNNTLILSNAYDLAGRLVSTTDALNQTTSYAESLNGNGELVKTTTYPDNSTRIETYFQDGQLKSVTGTAVRGVKYDYGVEQESGVYRRYVKETKLNTEGTETTEWIKTFYDMLNHAYKTVYADGSYAQSWYNNKGQLTKQRDPDGVVTLYAYNDLGELEITAVDMDRNDVIDYAGTDRITRSQKSVVSSQGTTVQRTATTIYTTEGTENTETVAINDVAVDGTQAWQINYGLTNHTAISINRSTATKTVTTTAPDGSTTVRISEEGRVKSEERKDATGVQLSAVSYQYDGMGRQSAQVMAGGAGSVTTAFAYNNADQLTAVTNAVGLAEQQVTQYAYDMLGRRIQTTLPDGAQQFTAYWPTGEVATNWGARTYPVAYTYDYAGRMKTLTTWQDFATKSGPAVTTWNYSADRGFLTSKIYPSPQGGEGQGEGSSYTYAPAGRLARRTWARGITTDYTYNNAGELNGVTYSDSTPTVAAVYDRRGRRMAVTNGTEVATFTYNDAGQLLTEFFPNSGVTITNTFDSLQRREWLLVGTAGPAVRFEYDAASRLQSVTAGTNTATYSYLANSSLVSNAVFSTGSTAIMRTTKTYDNLNRLTRIGSWTGVSPVAVFDYQYNTANQRTRRTEADNSYWDYTYDALGQVTAGWKKWSDGVAVAGQQYAYAYDDIGNRQSAVRNSQSENYSANALNQYTQRTVPGHIWELGSAASNATVTINNQPVARKGEYFAREIGVANSASAVYTQLVTVGVLRNAATNQMDIVSSVTGKVFVAKSPELFAYDADGNLTNDGRWAYSWDAENRLISVVAQASLPASVPVQKLIFGYDHQSRRVSKVVSNYVSGSWLLASDSRFIYDGWNLLSELNATNGLVCSYTWGLDLSGSEQGAGGIGGLLFIGNRSSVIGDYAAAFDGNGNVAALVNMTTGQAAAAYEYGPFGELIRATGPLAKANPFRFSTKYQDDETGLLYYGYRYYQPSTGRWVSRDPQAEPPLAALTRAEILAGAFHVGATYFGAMRSVVSALDVWRFCENDPVGKTDLLGLLTTPGWRDWQRCTRPQVWGVRRNGQVPPADGCSFPSWLGFMLPRGGTADNPTGRCSFLDACNYHDLCYSNCRRTKARCDDGFIARMYRACNDCAAGLPNDDDRREFRRDCYKWADRYGWGVDSGVGENSYRNRQEQNCGCVCVP